MFFAEKGVYEACGMYSAEHILSALFCIAVVVFFAFLLKNIKLASIYRLIMVLSVLFFLLEGVKIFYNFYYGYTNIDSWVPLSFCSLFIYALALSGFGKGKLREFGNSFLVMGSIVAGFAFICVPATSLTIYPLFHFQCLYSMLYHSSMMLVGLLLLRSGIRPTKKLYLYYAVFFVFFATAAVIMNVKLGCNLMSLREPYNIPIPFLHTIRKSCQVGYTALACICYLIIPPAGAFCVNKLFYRK